MRNFGLFNLLRRAAIVFKWQQTGFESTLAMQMEPGGTER